MQEGKRRLGGNKGKAVTPRPPVTPTARGEKTYMTFKEYQEQAIHTLLYPGSGDIMGLLYVVLGINGEAGEMAEKVKKILRDSNGQVSEEKRQQLILELGDVLWYAAATAYELGTTLEEVAQRNVDKLSSRHTRGKIQGSGDNR